MKETPNWWQPATTRINTNSHMICIDKQHEKSCSILREPVQLIPFYVYRFSSYQTLSNDQRMCALQ